MIFSSKSGRTSWREFCSTFVRVLFATSGRDIRARIVRNVWAQKYSAESTFLDRYCSTVQGLLDWFEVDLGFTEHLFVQIDLCVMCFFVLYSPVALRGPGC